jgi:hypothetical protein
VSRSGEGVAREEASRGRSEGAGAARDEAGIAGREADRRNEANIAPNQSLTFFLFSCIGDKAVFLFSFLTQK